MKRFQEGWRSWIQSSRLFVILLALHVAHTDESGKESARERLKLLYEAMEQGNAHTQAMESVEEGLGGGHGGLADNMQTLERGSDELRRKLTKQWPEASSAASSFGTSADLLHEMKSEPLSRLQNKILKENLFTGSDDSSVGASPFLSTPYNTVQSRKDVASEVYGIVRQRLSMMVPWSYHGDSGPEQWDELGYGTCAKGQLQSPIDIETVSATTRAIDILNIDVLNWQFPPSQDGDSSLSSTKDRSIVTLTHGPPKLFLDLPVNSRFTDTSSFSSRRSLLWWGSGPLESYSGHSFTVESLGSPKLFVDGSTYQLREFHIHTPSEHRIDGNGFDMEIQFVHTLDGSGGANFVIISFLFSAGDSADSLFFLKRLAAVIKNEHFGSSPKRLDRRLSFEQIADSVQSAAHMTRYYKYRGSLTQPPCTEDVTWFVIKEPLVVDAESLAAFSELEGRNNRPVQDLNNRIVEFTP